MCFDGLCKDNRGIGEISCFHGKSKKMAIFRYVAPSSLVWYILIYVPQELTAAITSVMKRLWNVCQYVPVYIVLRDIHPRTQTSSTQKTLASASVRI